MSESATPEQIDLNLDTLEKEQVRGKPAAKPFTFLLNEHVYTMSDANDVDWRDLVDMEHPLQLLRYVMSDEDRELFKQQTVAAHRLNGLMERYMKHFGFKMPEGKGAASLL